MKKLFFTLLFLFSLNSYAGLDEDTHYISNGTFECLEGCVKLKVKYAHNASQVHCSREVERAEKRIVNNYFIVESYCHKPTGPNYYNGYIVLLKR